MRCILYDLCVGFSNIVVCACVCAFVCVCVFVSSPARPSRQQRHRANSDSAVSGNIRVHAGKLMGMPHSILHAVSTFQFNAA